MIKTTSNTMDLLNNKKLVIETLEITEENDDNGITIYTTFTELEYRDNQCIIYNKYVIMQNDKLKIFNVLPL